MARPDNTGPPTWTGACCNAPKTAQELPKNVTELTVLIWPQNSTNHKCDWASIGCGWKHMIHGGHIMDKTMSSVGYTCDVQHQDVGSCWELCCCKVGPPWIGLALASPMELGFEEFGDLVNTLFHTVLSSIYCLVGYIVLLGGHCHQEMLLLLSLHIKSKKLQPLYINRCHQLKFKWLEIWSSFALQMSLL